MTVETLSHFSILLVDDEPLIRTTLFQYLTNAGYSVHLADAGDNALAFLRDNSGAIDVLVTDLRMPRIDGATLATIVQREYSHIKIIVMSGTPDDPAFANKLRALKVPVLMKIDLHNTLLAILQEMTARLRILRSQIE